MPPSKNPVHSSSDIFSVGSRAAWTWASMSGMPSSNALNLLDDHGYALAHADTHRREAVSHLVPPLHLVHERRQDAGTRGPQRMPERYRPAVRVEPPIFWVQLPLVQAGQALRRERLVELYEAHVVERDAGAAQGLLGGGQGTDAHHPRRYPRGCHAPDFGHRREAACLGVLAGDDHHRRGAVV